MRPERWRHGVAELGSVLVVLVLLAAAALAFVPPWTSAPATALDRFSPMADGQAWLQQVTEDGVTTFESVNVRRVPVLTALSDWSDASGAALREVLAGGQDGLDDEQLLRRAEDAVAVEVHQTTRDASGALDLVVAHQLRDARGDWLTSVHVPAEQTEIVYDPPLQVTDASLEPGATWTSTGTVGAARYRFTGEVAEVGAWDGGLGSFTDCRRVHSTLVTTMPDQDPVETAFDDWYCADAASGLVESVAVPQDGPRRDVVVVSDDGAGTVDGATLAALAGSAGSGDGSADGSADVAPVADARSSDRVGPGGDPAGWSLSRWGRPGTTLSMSEPTGAPVVLDGARPLVLTSSALHGLTAFDATDPDTVVWRFRPRGTVLGGPVVDPATGDVYVGSSGRRLSKLSRDGMFLWSHETGDNVAARPVLVDDVVVVPGEDATVQGLDAVTGAVLWSVRTTGPMVSSPALADGVVAMGSDSGAVHGLDPETGEEVWRFDAGDPVEAPVVADGRRFLVTTATGLRIALDAATGEELWSRETGVDQRSGAVVDGATMLLVDSSGGWMAAYSTEDGGHRWTSEVSDLVGAPVVLDGIAYARDRAGLVHALDVEDGAEAASWDPADGAFAADGGSTARFGLAAGAGALWMSDDSTVLRRLGPPSAGDADPLVPVWSATGSDAPFDSTFDTTPAAWRDAVLYLDHSRGVFRVDPATGEAERLGTMPGEGFAATGPVVSGDVLLATGVDGLQAASLPGLEPLWSVPLPSTVLQPPAVDDGVVVVALASGSDDAGVAQGSVLALDLVDGRLLWSADLGDVMFAAGAAVDGSVVHVAGRALDLRTGTELWRTPIEDALPSGGTGVGDGLVVGAVLSPDAQDGALVAWSADGELLWRSAEPGFGLDITEQPHVAPSAVVAASFDGSVVGHDRETGERRWDWRPPAAGTYGGIATVGDRVWVMTLEARVYVLDAASGEPVASFTALDIPLESSDVAQRPAAVRDVVVLPLGFVLLALPAADGAV